MSRLSSGFLATAIVIALALGSIQVQLVDAGSLPTGSTYAPAVAHWGTEK
ncbi:hypothetical protein [Paracoccus benzoatiresistens]|uniref:Uncharacterized protein n=1 Tax=Paracoccus benzoatiresistens TaxID=2997341 RepID=A0ABT4JBB1_9RHOB|nr:hypothetical protein [Paracoccus sp. EF6]MCZ0963761.1 hypothetical protein [Paracoccus sp. EF6]